MYVVWTYRKCLMVNDDVWKVYSRQCLSSELSSQSSSLSHTHTSGMHSPSLRHWKWLSSHVTWAVRIHTDVSLLTTPECDTYTVKTFLSNEIAKYFNPACIFIVIHFNLRQSCSSVSSMQSDVPSQCHSSGIHRPVPHRNCPNSHPAHNYRFQFLPFFWQ